MSRWGKVDMSGLYQLQEQLKQAQQEIDKAMYEVAQMLADEFLKGVIARTPQSETNGMKKHWKKDIRKQGTSYVITVWNDLDYASYVEYGKKIPGGGFQKGYYMCKITEQEIERKMNNIAAPIIDRHLREIFK